MSEALGDFWENCRDEARACGVTPVSQAAEQSAESLADHLRQVFPEDRVIATANLEGGSVVVATSGLWRVDVEFDTQGTVDHLWYSAGSKMRYGKALSLWRKAA